MRKVPVKLHTVPEGADDAPVNRAANHVLPGVAQCCRHGAVRSVRDAVSEKHAAGLLSMERDRDVHRGRRRRMNRCRPWLAVAEDDGTDVGRLVERPAQGDVILAVGLEADRGD